MENDARDEKEQQGESGSFNDDRLTRASMFARLGSRNLPDRNRAWSEFRSRYAPIIAGFASRCGASRQDIDDIIQDVLTSFLGSSGEFVYDPAKGRFRGYLKTCTIRAAIRRAGKNVRYRGIPLDEIPQAELAVEPVWNDAWEQQLIAEALVLIREQCQNSTSFRAFEQYVLLDRSAEVVAAELGINVNSVHQAKTRMTKQLRDVVQRLRASEEE